MEKELKNIPGLPKDQKVIIRKLSWGEKKLLIHQSTNVKVKPSNSRRGVTEDDIDISINTYEQGICLMDLGIVSNDFFPQTMDRQTFLRKHIEGETGEFIENELRKLNDLGNLDDVEKKSVQPSTEKESLEKKQS